MMIIRKLAAWFEASFAQDMQAHSLWKNILSSQISKREIWSIFLLYVCIFEAIWIQVLFYPYEGTISSVGVLAFTLWIFIYFWLQYLVFSSEWSRVAIAHPEMPKYGASEIFGLFVFEKSIGILLLPFLYMIYFFLQWAYPIEPIILFLLLYGLLVLILSRREKRILTILCFPYFFSFRKYRWKKQILGTLLFLIPLLWVWMIAEWIRIFLIQVFG